MCFFVWYICYCTSWEFFPMRNQGSFSLRKISSSRVALPSLTVITSHWWNFARTAVSGAVADFLTRTSISYIESPFSCWYSWRKEQTNKERKKERKKRRNWNVTVFLPQTHNLCTLCGYFFGSCWHLWRNLNCPFDAVSSLKLTTESVWTGQLVVKAVPSHCRT